VGVRGADHLVVGGALPGLATLRRHCALANVSWGGGGGGSADRWSAAFVARHGHGVGRFAPGQTPKQTEKADLSIGLFCLFGCPGWIRTTECLSQSQVPYRLATGQYVRAIIALFP
jgi:hypothetical protein